MQNKTFKFEKRNWREENLLWKKIVMFNDDFNRICETEIKEIKKILKRTSLVFHLKKYLNAYSKFSTFRFW